MFIGHDVKKLILAPLGAKRFISESHISLLRSEEVLFWPLVYKYFAALRRGQHLCLGLSKQHTKFAVEKQAMIATVPAS